MVSCEDKQNQAPPQEFDGQIDSIVAAPLPVINPDMIDQSLGGLDESSTRFRQALTRWSIHARLSVLQWIPIVPNSGI